MKLETALIFHGAESLIVIPSRKGAWQSPPIIVHFVIGHLALSAFTKKDEARISETCGVLSATNANSTFFGEVALVSLPLQVSTGAGVGVGLGSL